MISKEMYDLLKLIPRHPKIIDYAELKKVSALGLEDLYSILCDAQYDAYGYINSHKATIKDGAFSLTEKGQAAIEDYEQTQNNQKMVEDSLNTAKRAMWAAFASAVAAIIALIQNFC